MKKTTPCNKYFHELSYFGLADREFVRGGVPMTKAETRWLIAGYLQLTPSSRLLDIGAGTGSVSVECARLCHEVVAVERESKAAALIKKNIDRFGAGNIKCICGEAPEAFRHSGVFDRVFIGGSGGRLETIFKQLPPHVSPGARIVVSAITLETFEEVRQLMKNTMWKDVRLVQAAAAHSESIGSGNQYLRPANPVWIFSANYTPRSDDASKAQTNSRISSGKSETGIIYGIGLGPGDPELISLKAQRLLRSADVIFVPKAQKHRASKVLSIARPHLINYSRIVELVLPMTESSHPREQAWIKAAKIIIKEAKKSRSIGNKRGGIFVYPVLGDALFYSTWGYVLAALRKLAPEIRTVTIPGIPAMSACAAAMQTPLAEGREPLLIWPDDPRGMKPVLAQSVTNFVFMKAGPHMEHLAEFAESSDADITAVRNVSVKGEGSTDNLRVWKNDMEYFTTAIMHRRKKI